MSPQAMKNISTAPSTASESSASTSTSASVPHHNYGHGFRSQIGQFLPKHVLFQVHLHIDQLSNVPLISGEFAVRWKFKNVQSSSGLLSKMKGNRSWPGMGRKGKGKNRDTGFEIEVTPAEDEDEAQMEDADEESSAQESEDEFTQDEHTDSAEFGGYLTSSPPDTPNPTATSTPASPLKTNPTTSPATQSEARGMTDWAKLYSYNVKWERRLNVAVQMDVHRETGDLLPNELKLVVMQVSNLHTCSRSVVRVSMKYRTAYHPRRSEFTSSTSSRGSLPQPCRIRRSGSRDKTVPPTPE